MHVLLAVIMFLQPVDSASRSLDTEAVSELVVMPDGRMRHLLIWDVRNGAMPRSDELRCLQAQKESLMQLVADGKRRVVALPVNSVQCEWGTRHQWTVYCEDVNTYRWFSAEGNDFHFQRTTNGYRLIVNNSAVDSLDIVGKRAKEVITMPGQVHSATGCHSTVGRKVVTELSESDFEMGVVSEKLRVAKIAPRVIECGPASLEQKEIAVFNREFDGAMRDASNR